MWKNRKGLPLLTSNAIKARSGYRGTPQCVVFCYASNSGYSSSSAAAMPSSSQERVT